MGRSIGEGGIRREMSGGGRIIPWELRRILGEL
jgi:hypothetical protein